MNGFDHQFTLKPSVTAFRNTAPLIGLIILWDLTWRQAFQGAESRQVLKYAVDLAVITGPISLVFHYRSRRTASKLKQLTMRADFDQLSGLLNRQSFYERLKSALQPSSGGLVLMIDADHFKELNDTHGHAAGDHCIREIGKRLKENLRVGDIAGRIGGEEFAVFLPEINANQGKKIATQISRPIVTTNSEDQSYLKLTMSVGAVWVEGESVAEVVMSRADKLMYSAKKNGRSQIVFGASCDAAN